MCNYFQKLSSCSYNNHPRTNDAAIRSLLKSQINQYYQNLDSVKIIDEMGINHGTNRIDLAVIGDTLDGYEIKSDLDTLKRLAKQSSEYNKIFDKMTIVVGINHLLEVIELVPDYWGIILVKYDERGNLYLSVLREAEQNPTISLQHLTRLLWKDEALKILDSMNASYGVQSKSRHVIYDKLISIFREDKLKGKIIETLLLRSDWRAEKLQASYDG